MKGYGFSCGACKFLRRRCTRDCVFSPYFSYDQAATHFAAVHKIFGASNFARLLLHLPLQSRSDAAITISYEALARMEDPIYGCVAHIYVLQEQVASLQREIDEVVGNLMPNSFFGADNFCSVQELMNSNKGIEYLVHQDATWNIQCYPSPLSHEESGTVYQDLDRQNEIELVHANGFEEYIYGEPEPNPFEKFLSGIDQEVFLSHPWFKHNADIKN